MQKTPYVFPIVGGRKVEHLLDNITALDIALSTEQIKYLEDVLPFNPGFPHDMIVSIKLRGSGAVYLLRAQGNGTEHSNLFKRIGGVHYDRWPVQEALRPASQ